MSNEQLTMNTAVQAIKRLIRKMRLSLYTKVIQPM